MSGIAMILVYVVIIGGFYLIAIRPQKKREKAHQALVDSVEVGDSILTTSGFYGVVIDMTDEVVIVEFGNNKNCRIPMQRAAIVEVDKGEENSVGHRAQRSPEQRGAGRLCFDTGHLLCGGLTAGGLRFRFFTVYKNINGKGEQDEGKIVTGI